MITSSRDGLLHQFIDKMKDPNYRQQSFYPLAEDVAQDFTPVVGEAKSAYEADQAFKNMGRTFRGGDYFSSAGYLGEGLTGLLGAVPVLGLGVTGVNKLTKPIAEQAPVFYSKLTNFFKDAPQKKAQGKQWQGMLEPQKSGVKSEEVEYTGIKSLLDENPDKVFTKEELKDVADSNRIEVEERVYGLPEGGVFPFDEWAEENFPKEWQRATGFLEEGDTDAFLGIQRVLFKEYEKGLLKGTDLETRHDSYQLKGGENYRELVLKLPQKEVTSNYKITPEIVNGETRYAVRDAETGNLLLDWNGEDHTGRYYRTEEEAQRALRGAPTKEKPLFSYTSHFPDANPLLHVRFNDRIDADGGKQLFIEELQSDWAQRGREKGFKSGKTVDELYEEAKPFHDRFYSGKRNMSDEEWRELSLKVKYYDDLILKQKQGVEPAPFVTSTDKWTDLGLRRMLRWGVDNGYDSIGWTTGVQQVNRYQTAFRQQVKSLKFDKPLDIPMDAQSNSAYDAYEWRALHIQVNRMVDSGKANTDVEQFNRVVKRKEEVEEKLKNAGFALKMGKDGPDFNSGVEGWVKPLGDEVMLEIQTPLNRESHILFEKNKDGKYVTANEYEGEIQPLEKIVGKDVAKQFYEGETYFEGDDLTIGGEGFKESYDKIIPKRMKEIARKMGEKNVKIEKRMFDDGFSRQRELMKAYKDRYNAFIPEMEKMAEEANIPLRDFFKTFPDHPATMLRERIDDFNDQLIKNLNKQMLKEKRTNWSMKITDKMREAIKKGLPLMAGAGVSTGLLAEYQNQKNQNQSLLY